MRVLGEFQVSAARGGAAAYPWGGYCDMILCGWGLFGGRFVWVCRGLGEGRREKPRDEREGKHFARLIAFVFNGFHELAACQQQCEWALQLRIVGGPHSANACQCVPTLGFQGLGADRPTAADASFSRWLASQTLLRDAVSGCGPCPMS
jgi:hypothetical protein